MLVHTHTYICNNNIKERGCKLESCKDGIGGVGGGAEGRKGMWESNVILFQLKIYFLKFPYNIYSTCMEFSYCSQIKYLLMYYLVTQTFSANVELSNSGFCGRRLKNRRKWSSRTIR